MRMLPDPGDIFVDGDGMAWLSLNPQPKDTEPMVQFLWFTSTSHGVESDEVRAYLSVKVKPGYSASPECNPDIPVPLSLLRQPFKLAAELGKE